MSYRVKFWGVRGSIACPSQDHVAYGGNTSCVEISLGEHVFILDAGTGIRLLGRELLKRGVKSATLLLTHTHWDHINGFPFFSPAFVRKFSFNVRAGHLYDQGGIESVLATQMSHPMFPVPLSVMQARMTFIDFKAGDSFDLGDGIKVATAPLRHPNGAAGYRISFAGKTLAYVTDTEHVPGEPDPNVLRLMEGVDLAIYDSTYTDEEFPAKVGWGHSTWQEGVRLGLRAGTKRLAIFHHDPEHEDDQMAAIEAAAQEMWDQSFCARDGMEIVL